jgi:hypothetical protein
VDAAPRASWCAASRDGYRRGGMAAWNLSSECGRAAMRAGRKSRWSAHRLSCSARNPRRLSPSGAPLHVEARTPGLSGSFVVDMRFNEARLRERGAPPAKPADRDRVLALGGSVTLGWDRTERSGHQEVTTTSRRCEPRKRKIRSEMLAKLYLVRPRKKLRWGEDARARNWKQAQPWRSCFTRTGWERTVSGHAAGRSTFAPRNMCSLVRREVLRCDRTPSAAGGHVPR